MKFSVITATFNSEKTIRATLESVGSQVGVDYEHLIQDGGSVDKTTSIIGDMPHLNTSIEIKPDKSIYEGLNNALLRATGDLIGFCHSDDVYADQYVLQDYVSFFDQTDADLVYADLDFIGHKGGSSRVWRGREFDKKLINKGWMPAHPTIIVKREVYNSVGLFNTKYRTSADYDWVLRCLKNPNINVRYLNRTVMKMALGGQSTRGIKNIISQTLEDYEIVKNNQIGGLFTVVQKKLSKIAQYL